MAKTVVGGACTYCIFAVPGPSVLAMPNTHNDQISGSNVANITDHIPGENIVPFGFCRSPFNPAVIAALGVPQLCIPLTPLPWYPGNKNDILEGNNGLDDTCFNCCIWAGVIGFAKAGQNSVFISDAVPPDSQQEAKKTIKAKVEAYKKSSAGKALINRAAAIASQKPTMEELVPLMTGILKDPAADEPLDTSSIVEMVYIPESKTFVALTAKEKAELDSEDEEFAGIMKNLNVALADKSDGRLAKIKAAKQAALNKLQPLVNGPDSGSITEIVRLKGKKYTYVQSDKVKNHWRSYSVANDDAKKSVLKNGKLDTAALKKKFKEKMKPKVPGINSDIKWDYDIAQASSSFGEWASSFNQTEASVLAGDPEDPKGVFYATSDAQLLRYTSAATVNGSFKPNFTGGSFGSDINNEFALAEAKIESELYIPNKSGLNVSFKLPDRDGNLREIDFGAFRAGFNFVLSSYAGATANIGLELQYDIDPKEGMKVKGLASGENEAKASADVFVGAKAGGEITGNAAWKSPEPKEEKDADGWCIFADAKFGGDGSAGLGVNAEFQISFAKGKFVIRAKAGIVCGVGMH